MTNKNKIIIYTDGGARGNHGPSLRSLKPCGFNTSATGKLPFSRPLSRPDVL